MIEQTELLMLLGDKDVLLYEKEKDIRNLTNKLRDLEGITNSLLKEVDLLRNKKVK